VTDPKNKHPPLKLVSIHSSALYAPYPFANGKPEDMRVPDAFDTPVAGFQVDVQKMDSAPGDGFARIEIGFAKGGHPMVTVWFHKANGAQDFGPFHF
jgi:hypothetical protein